MLNYKLLVLVIPAFLLGACSITGPADDGFENSNEWVDNGRLLSDDSSGFTIYSSEKKKTSGAAENSGTDSPSNNELDYAAYRQWQDAKRQNSPEYQKFRQWQEFEDYQRWKEQLKAE
ncbi:MAG: hypothetical protein OEU50_14090 [Gammaproteobacteria bacterium]|nr:hypothetical protein [Gammaproteobacteria bacterium]